MRSRGNRRLPGTWLAVLLASAPFASLADEPATRTAVRETEVHEAIAKVSTDPALTAERSMRRLRWIGDGEEQAVEPPGWVEWIAEMFGWFAQASRLLVWLVIILLVALFVLYAVRIVRSFERQSSGSKATPTHVRDLDIRPESLPDDIGAAAWALWEQSEHREAMSLLYRGLLSRLVHVHEVPIRDSSTEGDSLALAERHLPRARHGYVARLIRTWQHSVYGGNDPQGPEVRLLCEQFAGALLPPDAGAEVRA